MNDSTTDQHPLFSLLLKYQLWLLMATGGLTIAFTLHDYGIAWDERPLSVYAELVYAYFASGFNDTRCNEYLDSRFYSPLFELLTFLPYKLFNAFRYEFRHLFVALTALLTVLGTAKFAHLFKNSAIAFFSPLFLILMPRFYGHSFFNSKDIPFACAFVWAMYAIGKLISGRIQLRRSVFTGVMIGLALSVRVGGLLLFFFFFVIVAYSHLRKEAEPEFTNPPLHWLLHGAIILLVAWTIMVISWPWVHANPILNPLKALKMFSSFHAVYPVLFEGTIFPSNQLPWYYLPKYLFLTTPPLILALALVGMVDSGWVLFKKDAPGQGRFHFTILLWFFFPVLFAIFRRPNIYDGIRHFLFILPALAVFAGCGVAVIIRKIKANLRTATVFVILLLSITILKNHAGLHPYQMTYFNIFAGGLKAAATQYETDYWATSYKEAAEWVNEKLAKVEKKPVVLVAGNEYNRLCFEYFLDPRIKTEFIFENTPNPNLPASIDYYISTTRYTLHQNFFKERVCHTIGREGANFTVIKNRTPKSKKKT